MYSDIVIPSEGDGSTFTLVGHGYYRGTRLAGIGYRLLAFAIDAGIFYLATLIVTLLMQAYMALTDNTGRDVSVPDAIVGVVLSLIPWAVLVANSVVMQARTGQSFGKLCFGMIVVSPKVDPMNVAVAYYTLPSPIVVVARTVMHLTVDLFLCLGVVSILLSKRQESLADRACNTLVLRPRDLDSLTLHKGLLGARDR